MFARNIQQKAFISNLLASALPVFIPQQEQFDHVMNRKRLEFCNGTFTSVRIYQQCWRGQGVFALSSLFCQLLSHVACHVTLRIFFPQDMYTVMCFDVVLWCFQFDNRHMI